MTNYICINGKKAELTEEQMKALGIELPMSNPFERVCNKANDFYHYYFINSYGFVAEDIDRGFENGNGNDDLRYRTANYCTDETLMRQRALHEILNRLLWRYSMEHKANRIDDKVWSIKYDYDHKTFITGWVNYKTLFLGEINFNTEEVAKNAIKEIIEPFMAAHPEFKW